MAGKVKRPSTSRRRQKPTLAKHSDFWQHKTIEQLRAEQGVGPAWDRDKYFGAGAHLWASDEDFERFLEGLNQRSREDK